MSEQQIDLKFIEQLNELREKLGFSWKELGDGIEVSGKTLFRWKSEVEKSKTNTYSVQSQQLVNICKATNCFPNRLKLPSNTQTAVTVLLKSDKWEPKSKEQCLFDYITPITDILPLLEFPHIMQGHFHYKFVGLGETAPSFTNPIDELWLDVGNDLRAGVIDHHQQIGKADSSTQLVYNNPKHISEAVNQSRDPTTWFTIVIQENIDLDCLASTYLATHFLNEGTFPSPKEIIERFVRYVNRTDQGYLCMTLENPFSLHAAIRQLTREVLLMPLDSDDGVRLKCVHNSFKLFDYVLKIMEIENKSMLEIDAFDCPGIFTKEEKEFVNQDIQRYHQKLLDPRCCARKGKLHLPLELGGISCEIDALLVRDANLANDPESCQSFRTWGRSDHIRAKRDNGFVLLSEFVSDDRGRRFCIISIKPEVGEVNPDRSVNLNGLGNMLEKAERCRRVEIEGRDARLYDKYDNLLAHRPGYDHPDPWYDGRGHNYTIIDSPGGSGGTILEAEEIEEILFQFGEAKSEHFLPLYSTNKLSE